MNINDLEIEICKDLDLYITILLGNKVLSNIDLDFFKKRDLYLDHIIQLIQEIKLCIIHINNVTNIYAVCFRQGDRRFRSFRKFFLSNIVYLRDNIEMAKYKIFTLRVYLVDYDEIYNLDLEDYH